eukprot:scaffold4074_cov85-Skeletonema_dohrnii-CCMP3373.AAC.1
MTSPQVAKLCWGCLCLSTGRLSSDLGLGTYFLLTTPCGKINVHTSYKATQHKQDLSLEQSPY